MNLTPIQERVLLKIGVLSRPAPRPPTAEQVQAARIAELADRVEHNLAPDKPLPTLNEMVSLLRSRPWRTIHEALDLACAAYKTRPVFVLHEHGRRRFMVVWTAVAVVGRERLGLSYPQLARALNRSHSTVLQAIRRFGLRTGRGMTPVEREEAA